jgi:uncharacterized membrane protein YkvA (DUF1232 family)
MQAGTYVHPSTGDVGVGRLTGVKNRIINGGMLVDQRGGGACVGGSAAAVSYTVDRWACAAGAGSGTLAAGQVALSAADRAATGQGYAAAVGPAPSVGLAAYFPFDGNENDASGNGVVLTRVGNVSYVPGRVGSSAVYLANTATQSTASTNTLTCTYSNFTQPFTITFWFNATSIPTATTPCMFITSVTNLTNAVAIYVDPTKIWISFNNIANNGGSTTTISTNTWYHVCITYVGTTLTLYVNGSINGNTLTGTCATNGFMISPAVAIAGLTPFAGFIDDFRIYNRALSAAEIAALANIAPLAPAPATTLASGLTTRLTFDNTTADAQGTLAAPTGTPAYSSASKSGTACLDLTANTAGSATITKALSYAYTSNTLPISIAFWMNASSVSAGQVIIGTSPGSAIGWQITVTSSALLYMDIYPNGATGYTTSSASITIAANTWYFVCGVIASSQQARFFINGVQVAVSSTIPANSTLGNVTALRIGSQTTSALAFKGLIDDVRIYNRALTPQEVAGLYYSYQPAPYVLYQQPIEGLNVADLGWGTSGAQPAAVSCWIKNNTSTAQQFSLSAGNAGAAAAVAAITFESGIEDTLGYLTNPVGVNVSYATSVYKVGSRALDLTANTAGGTPATYAMYNLSMTPLPFSVSCWINTSSISALCVPLVFTSTLSGGWGYTIILSASGQMYVDCTASGSSYVIIPSTSTAILANTWVHIATTIAAGDYNRLYINGVQVATSSVVASTATAITPNTGGGAITRFCIGTRDGTNYAFKGYIDDVRIYNRALTAAEVYQLYTKNAASTTISQYLLPRSYLYTTPTIAAGAWKYISFTVPGDTTDAAWATDTTCGINVALCLGAGGPYVGTTTSAWASAKYLTGSNVQAFGGAATNFLASAGNSLLITGVQLEKGAVATPFDVRSFASELAICMRYYQQYTSYFLGLAFNINFGYNSGLPLKITMRAIPSLQPGATFTVDSGSAGSPAIYTATTDMVTIWNPSNNWGATAQIRFSGGFNAEL